MAQGSVRKKGNIWYYRYYDTDGKQIERSGGSTKAEALEKLNSELNRQYKGYSRPSEMLLSEYLDMWLEDFVKEKVSENTYYKYKSACEKRINPSLGKKRLCDLKVLDIEKFLKELKKPRKHSKTNKELKPPGNTTLQKYYQVLNTALNRAVKLQMIIDNPCKFIDPPKRDKFKAEILTLEEVSEIIKMLDEKNYEDYIFRLALDITLETGLRRGEMCGLTWKDIDFNKKYIDVNKALIKVDGKGYLIGGTKTEGSERIIPISDDLIEKLKKHKTKQKENKLQYGEFYLKNIWNGKEFDLLFTWRDGDFISPSNFRIKLKKICKKCGIEKNIRWHDLRHTNATLLLESDVNLKVIQERLGHTLLQTTSDLYTHVTKKLNRNATDKISSLLKY